MKCLYQRTHSICSVELDNDIIEYNRNKIESIIEIKYKTNNKIKIKQYVLISAGIRKKSLFFIGT